MLKKSLKKIHELNWRIKVILLSSLVVVAIFAFSRLSIKPSSPQYQTATVQRGTIVSAVSASGNVLSANFVPVTTQAGGTVSEVYVSNGDRVYAGQAVMDLTLDRTGMQKNAAAFASYLSTVNSLNAAQAKLNSLQSAMFKANQAFVNDRGIPNPTEQDKSDPKYVQERADWLQAEADYKNQQGVIAQAQSAVNSASLTLAQSSPQITAPSDGVVDSITYVPGMVITSQSVSASNSNTDVRVAVIRNEKTPVASVNVSEIDVHKIKAGQKVTLILDSLEGKTFTGIVVSIDRIGNSSSNVTNYPALIQFDSGSDQILPNMAVTANVIIDSKNDVLFVPSAAVQTEGEISTVRVLKDGKPSVVDVQTGFASDSQIEIVSGELKEGDIIVTGTSGGQGTSSSARSVFSSPSFGGFGGGGTIRFGSGGTRVGGR